MDLKFSSIYKIISSLICSAGLLYQLSQLFEQFLSGKTVVNVEVKNVIDDNFPAFTICFPTIYSIESMGKYSPDYKQDYESYKSMAKEIQDIDEQTSFQYKQEMYQNYKLNLTSIYNNVFKISTSKLYDKNYIYVIIDNISIPYIYTKDAVIRKSILVTAEGYLPGK